MIADLLADLVRLVHVLAVEVDQNARLGLRDRRPVTFLTMDFVELAPLPASVQSILGRMSSGHLGDVRPDKPSFVLGGLPAMICSILLRLTTSTLDLYRPFEGSVRLSSADTPSNSPALRTIGCMIEPLYCTQSNHGVFQIRG